MSSLDYLMRIVAGLQAKSTEMASYRWATVTTADPLRIRFDADTEAQPASPTNLAGPLCPGQRVWVITVLRRAIVVGVAGGSGAPTGAILAYAGAAAPPGWLLCDGASYQKSTYPALAAALGATGSGMTFQVPDMRGRTAVGASGAYPLGSTGGEAMHTLTTAEMPSHTHKIVGTASKWAVGAGIYESNVGGGSGWETISNWTSGANYLAATSEGGGQAHNNMPPFRAVNWIIKT